MCSLMFGVYELRCQSQLLQRSFEDIQADQTSSFDDSPTSDFFPAMVSRGVVFSG